MPAKEKYRFETGSLYEYSNEHNAYIHVWKNAFDDTKAKAIKAYENSEQETEDR